MQGAPGVEGWVWALADRRPLSRCPCSPAQTPLTTSLTGTSVSLLSLCYEDYVSQPLREDKLYEHKHTSKCVGMGWGLGQARVRREGRRVAVHAGAGGRQQRSHTEGVQALEHSRTCYPTRFGWARAGAWAWAWLLCRRQTMCVLSHQPLTRLGSLPSPFLPPPLPSPLAPLGCSGATAAQSPPPASRGCRTWGCWCGTGGLLDPTLCKFQIAFC